MTTTAGAVDVTDPAHHADPYPLFAWLRTHEPVHWSPRLRMWVLTRYDDVLQVVQDTARFSVDRFRKGPGGGQSLEAVGQILRDWAVYRDPPDHARLRRALGRAFAAHRVESLRPRIQAIVDGLLDACDAQPTIDFVRDFAFPLPAAVIGSLLGLPAEDLGQIKTWSDQLARYIGGGQGRGAAVDAARQGLLDLHEYLRGVLRARERQPGDDLISDVLAARRLGDRLTEDEAVSNCVLMLFAGHETTTNLLANGLYHLFHQPAALDQLRAQPALAAAAVEELLRFDAPVSGTLRIALEDLTLHDRPIARGQVIAAFLASANRDPAHFIDADRLQLTREPNRHLAFAAGIHFCLGAGLARLETQIALRTLLARYPRMRLRDEPPEWKPQLFFRGLRRLPIDLY